MEHLFYKYQSFSAVDDKELVYLKLFFFFARLANLMTILLGGMKGLLPTYVRRIYFNLRLREARKLLSPHTEILFLKINY